MSPTGYKEEHSKGPMLRFEESLPRLPVPSLEETAKRYLKSLHPLLSKSEYEYSCKVVQEFLQPGGPGQTLQTRLLARREDADTKNWIIDWWNESAYLGYRDPVIPYVSYFYSHRDDRKRRDPAKRAAAISAAVLAFKKQVDEGTLEPEYMRKLPIAMNSYEYMFNCCRIPKKPVDEPKKYDYKQNAYIVVVRKNQFFKVMHEIGGKQLNTAELEAQFRRVYEIAEPSAPIGILTTENRDKWAEVHVSHP
jgi:carnitine O-acetyltransferase